MSGESSNDPELETLLELSEEVFPLINGYWTKFEAYLVDPTDQIPLGFGYSLTLHDPSGQRVLAFDNAHRVKSKGKRFGARKVTWDHKHAQDKTTDYEFESAGQLMEDFWVAVDEIVK